MEKAMNMSHSTIALPGLFAAIVATVAIGLTGCSSLPERNSALEDARAAVRTAQADTQVVTLAGLELSQADEVLRRAEVAWRDHEDALEVDHLAYLARRRAAIAVETARLRAAEAAIITATAERDRVLLMARTREAERAQREAALAQLQADATQRRADEMRAQAALAQQQAAAARQDAASAQTQAAASQAQAQDAEARARLLASQLADLQAQRTDRGIVVTLGDVLFDPGRAELKPGGTRVLQRVADFLAEYPQRTVVIEGFTDSVGSESLNQDLSERRANTVRLALIPMGIDPTRITARGYGKAFPVASNDTSAGRQLNRRVEIVISDENGQIGPRRYGPERIGGLR
jgi:outer membrane protein OmpA-like peptidoglycan-associated protein